jgi:hypothetical protein
MDPYLEFQPFWSDFAPKLLTELSNTLLAQVFPRYDVRIEEYLLVTADQERDHRVEPDVVVSTTPAWSPGGAATALLDVQATELDYPESEPRKQRRLSLIHRATGRVVTVMELLSAYNKQPGELGRDAYLAKRAEFIASPCHLVELDLLRGGRRLPMVGTLPPGAYYALIGRAEQRPHCQVIAWSLRAPLPAMPIPLLAEDPEAALDLQAVFRAAYEPALYDRRLPYDTPLAPAPAAADIAWIKDRLAQRAVAP